MSKVSRSSPSPVRGVGIHRMDKLLSLIDEAIHDERGDGGCGDLP